MRRLITAIVLLTAIPLIAQTRHQISKIEFHSRVPANILLTQSALTEDRTYSDEEIELALSRLRRLPFVYSAVYAIDGSTLVIDVADEYRAFVHFDSVLQGLNSTTAGYGYVSGDVGGRYELKWGGVAEASFGVLGEQHLSQTAWNAAYRQYGLGGTRAFAMLGASGGGAGEITSPRLLIGYPLTLRQTVAITASREGYSEGGQFGTAGHYTATTRLKNLEAQWQWDTTNDPLFGTHGSALSLAQGINRQTDFSESVSSTGKSLFLNDSQTNRSTTHLIAAKFWPVGRGAFTANVNSELGRGHLDFRRSLDIPYTRENTSTRLTNATIGWAYNFFSSPASPHRNRIEIGVGLLDSDEKTGHFNHSDRYRTVQLGYAMRARWGSVHFVAAYLAE